MKSNLLICCVGVALLGFGCSSQPGDMSGMKMETPPATTQPVATPFQAVDVHNTICPVSGDKVEDSKLVEVYDGKVYHLCCDDCHKDFEKDPAKYEAAVSANPAKYGIQ